MIVFIVATDVVVSLPPKHRRLERRPLMPKHFSYNHLKDLSDFVLMIQFNPIKLKMIKLVFFFVLSSLTLARFLSGCGGLSCKSGNMMGKQRFYRSKNSSISIVQSIEGGRGVPLFLTSSCQNWNLVCGSDFLLTFLRRAVFHTHSAVKELSDTTGEQEFSQKYWA